MCPDKQENSILQAKSVAKNKKAIRKEGTCPGLRRTRGQGSLNREGRNQEERS